MISQHWFRQWLGAVWQKAIAWANVDPDLCPYMASLGHNELTHSLLYRDYIYQQQPSSLSSMHVASDPNELTHLPLNKMAAILADNIFKCIFLNENVWILIKISLKFVPKGPINTIPSLAQVMAWRRPGDKPLSETKLISLPTHICITRPQWVNESMCGGWFTAWYRRK